MWLRSLIERNSGVDFGTVHLPESRKWCVAVIWDAESLVFGGVFPVLLFFPSAFLRNARIMWEREEVAIRTQIIRLDPFPVPIRLPSNLAVLRPYHLAQLG